MKIWFCKLLILILPRRPKSPPPPPPAETLMAYLLPRAEWVAMAMRSRWPCGCTHHRDEEWAIFAKHFRPQLMAVGEMGQLRVRNAFFEAWKTRVPMHWNPRAIPEA